MEAETEGISVVEVPSVDLETGTARSVISVILPAGMRVTSVTLQNRGTNISFNSSC